MSIIPCPYPARLLLLTVPHPATRRAAEFIRMLIAADGTGISCELVTHADRTVEAGETRIYLRPNAADIMALAVMADPTAASDLRRACACLADLEDEWHDVPRLSLETVLGAPHKAIRLLWQHLGVQLGDPVFAEADARIATLRSDVAGYGHPLAFLASVELDVSDTRLNNSCWTGADLYDDGDAGIARFLSPDTPHRLSVLVGKFGTNSEYPLKRSGWSISEMPLDQAHELLTKSGRDQGVIHLHHVEDAAELDGLLPSIMTHLSPHGLLSGEERFETAAENVVARLTRGGDEHGLLFLLSGCRWLAAPRSWWR